MGVGASMAGASPLLASELAAGSSLSSVVLCPPHAAGMNEVAARDAREDGAAGGVEYDLSSAARQRLIARAADLEALLSAGVKEDASDKHVTVSRLMEELVSTLSPLSTHQKELQSRLHALAAVHSESKRERSVAEAPFVHPILSADRPDPAANRLKELVLAAVSALVTSATTNDGQLDVTVPAVGAALKGLQSLVADFTPESLFSEWSPARIAPERPLVAGTCTTVPGTALVDARRCVASHVQDALPAGAPLTAAFTAAVAKDGTGLLTLPPGDVAWRTDKLSKTVVWGVTFPRPLPISSVRLYWGNAAPASVAVEVTNDLCPDPCAHATRVSTRLPGVAPSAEQQDILLLTNPTATAAQTALQALVCDTPTDESGVGVTSTATVPDAVVPPTYALGPTASNPDAPVGAVTWRRVRQEVVDNAAAVTHAIVHALPMDVAPDTEVPAITGLRIILRGKHRDNTSKSVGLAAVQLMTSALDMAHSSPLRTVKDLQSWANAVAVKSHNRSAVGAGGAGGRAGAPAMLAPSTATPIPVPSDAEAEALSISLRLALASGSQAAVLRYVQALLALPAAPTTLAPTYSLPFHTWTRDWEGGLGTAHAADVEAGLKTLAAARVPAVKRFVAMCMSGTQSGPTGVVDIKWDPEECRTHYGDTKLEISNGGKTVYTPTSSNSMAVADRGFSSGKVVWVYKLDEDNNGSECSCFGAVRKPITDRNYNSPQALMYRAYNGQLYGEGQEGSNREKVHPNDLIEITYDADAGTLSYKINDKDQGVCFKGLKGVELFPAVSFYSSNRRISIMKCEVVSGGMAAAVTKSAAPAGGLDPQAVAEAAVKAMDEGGDAAAALAVVAQPSIAALTAVAAKVATEPEPVQPELADDDNEAMQATLHPGIEILVGMGFHWAMARDALMATSDSIEAAAEQLISGEISPAVGDETDARVARYHTALAKWETDHKAWEARVAERKKKEEEEEAAAAAAKTAAPTTSSAFIRTDSLQDDTTGGGSVSLRTLKPATRLTAAGAVLTLLQDLATAFTPGLVTSAPAPAPTAAVTATNNNANNSHGGVGGGGGGGEWATVSRRRGVTTPAPAAGGVGAPPAPTSSALDYLKPPPVTSQMAAMSLEEPFGIQAAGDNLVQLASLLRVFMSAYQQARKARLTADADVGAVAFFRRQRSTCRAIITILLRLVRANLHRIIIAHVHPCDAGITVTGARPTLAPLHAALEELMGGRGYDPALQLEAVRTVDAGLEVLYASAQMRADLLSSLIQRQRVGRRGGRGEVEADESDDEEVAASTAQAASPQAELLARCLRRFSTPAGVVSLLPPLSRTLHTAAAASDVQSQARDIAHLVASVLEVLKGETERQLSSAARRRVAPSSPGTPSTLLHHGAALLATFQRHLLSLVAEEVEAQEAEVKASKTPTPPGATTRATGAELSANAVDLATADPELLDVKLGGAKWAAATSLGATPACRVLLHYAPLLLKACTQIVDAASVMVEVQSSLAASHAGVHELMPQLRVDVDAILSTSIVHHLLPALALGIYHLSGQPIIASTLLPALVAFGKRLDTLVSHTIRLRMATQSVVDRALAPQFNTAMLAARGILPTTSGFSVLPVHRVVLAQAFVDDDGTLLSQASPPMELGSPVMATGKAASGYLLHEGSVSMGEERCTVKLWLQFKEGHGSTVGGKKDDKTSEVSGEGYILLPPATLATLLAEQGWVLPAVPHDGAPEVVDYVCSFGVSNMRAMVAPVNVTGTSVFNGPMNIKMELMLPVLAGMVNRSTAAASPAPAPAPAIAPVAGADTTPHADDESTGGIASFLSTIKRALVGGSDVVAKPSPAPAPTPAPAPAPAPSVKAHFVADVATCTLYLAGVHSKESGTIYGRSGQDALAVAAATSITAAAVAAVAASGGKDSKASAAGGEGGKVGEPVQGVGPAFLVSNRRYTTATALDDAAHVASVTHNRYKEIMAGRAPTPGNGCCRVGSGLMTDAHINHHFPQLLATEPYWPAGLIDLLGMCVGSLSATMITGPHVSYEEEEVRPLLRTHLFTPGAQFCITPLPTAIPFNHATRVGLDWDAASSGVEAWVKEAGLVQQAAAVGAEEQAQDTPEPPAALLVRGASAPDAGLAALLAAEGAGAASGAKLLELLNSSGPRRGGLKRKVVTFAEVELPLFLAMAKHTGQAGVVLDVVAALGRGEAPTLPPELEALWREVCFVRAFLRLQRADSAGGGAEEGEAGAAGRDAAGKKSEDPTLAAALATSTDPRLRRKLRVTPPSNVDDLIADMRARALFLLTLAPALEAGGQGKAAPTGGAGVGGGTTLARAPSSAGIGGMPLPSGGPSFTRHASSGAGGEDKELAQLHLKWGAMMPGGGVEQLRLRHATSSMGGSGVGGGGEGMPGPAKLARATSWAVVSEEDDAQWRTDLDDMAAEAADDESAASAIELTAKAVKEYVKIGFGGPPALLTRLLLWRGIRGAARTYGFAALQAYLATTTARPFATTNVLLFLRTSLRGATERLADAAGRVTVSGAGKEGSKEGGASSKDTSWLQRHHFASQLEGIPATLRQALQAAHAKLYTTVARYLADAITDRSARNASVIMWCLGVDVEEAEHGWLSNSALLPALAKLTSLPGQGVEHLDDGDVEGLGVETKSDEEWTAWRLDDVLAGLQRGNLSKADVLTHIAVAPHLPEHCKPADTAGAVVVATPRQWLRAALASLAVMVDAGCTRPSLRVAAAALTVSNVVDVYAAFTATPEDLVGPAAAGSRRAITSAWRVPVDPAAVDAARAARQARVVESVLNGTVLGEQALAEDEGFGEKGDGLEEKTGWDGAKARDTERRKAWKKRARTTLKHPGHTAHDLTALESRSHCRCDVCRRDVSAGGRLAWACPPDDWDCCELCFATRPGASPWEKGPVDKLKNGFTTGSSPTAVPLAPYRNMKVYADSDIKFDSVPAYMNTMPGRDYFTMVQLPKSGGTTSRSTVVLTLDVSVPVIVHLGIPSGMTADRCEAVTWLKKGFYKEGTSINTTGGGETMNLWRSMVVYCPISHAPPAAKEWLRSHRKNRSDTITQIELTGLGNTANSLNYCVILEEVLPANLSLIDVVGDAAFLELSKSGRGAGLPRTYVPIRLASIMRQSAWALFRLLSVMALGGSSTDSSSGASIDLAALGDGGAATTGLASPTPAAATPPTPSAAGPAVRARVGGMTPSEVTTKLHHTIFSLVRQHLAAAVDVMKNGGAKGRPAGTPDVDVMEAEALAHATIQFLLSISDTPGAKREVPTAPFLRMLLALFDVGSPRLQRCILLLMRRVATRLHPADLEHAMRGVWSLPVLEEWKEVATPGVGADATGSATPVASPIVGWLLDVIAAASLPVAGWERATPAVGAGDEEFGVGGGGSATGAASPMGDMLVGAVGAQQLVVSGAVERGRRRPVCGAGNVAQAVASEAVALVRTLCSLSGWRAVLLPLINDAVVESGTLASAATTAATDVSSVTAVRALGTYSVLGGFTEPLRIGSRVLVASFRVGVAATAGTETGAGVTAGKAGTGASGGGSGWGAGVGDLEAVLVAHVTGTTTARIVYARDLSATPANIDISRLVPLAEVAPPPGVLQLTPAVVSALRAIITSPSADLLTTRLKTMALGAVQAATRNASSLAALLNNGLLEPLYDVALQAIPSTGFVAVPALLAKYRSLEAQAYEAATAVAAAGEGSGASAAAATGAGAEGVVGGDGIRPGGEGLAEAGAAKDARLEAAMAMAAEFSLDAAVVDQALQLCDGDAARARVFLSVHREALASRPTEGDAAGLPTGVFVGARLLPPAATDSVDGPKRFFLFRAAPSDDSVTAAVVPVTDPALVAAGRKGGPLPTSMLLQLLALSDDAQEDDEEADVTLKALPPTRMGTRKELAGDDVTFARAAKAGHLGGPDITMGFDDSDDLRATLSLSKEQGRGIVAFAPNFLRTLNIRLHSEAVAGLSSKPLDVTLMLATSSHAHLVQLTDDGAATASFDKGAMKAAAAMSSGKKAEDMLLADRDLIPAAATGLSALGTASGGASPSAAANTAAESGEKGGGGSGPNPTARVGHLPDAPFTLLTIAPTAHPVLSAVEVTTAMSVDDLAKVGVTMVEYEVVKRTGSTRMSLGLAERNYSVSTYVGSNTDGWGYLDDGRKGNNGNWESCGSGYAVGDKVRVTYDPSAGTISFAVNGTEHGVGYTLASARVLFPAVTLGNTGDEVRIVATLPPGVCFKAGEQMNANLGLPEADNPFFIRSNSGSGGQSAVAWNTKEVATMGLDPKLLPAVAEMAKGASRAAVIAMLKDKCGVFSSAVDAVYAELESAATLRQVEAVVASLKGDGLIPMTTPSSAPLASLTGINFMPSPRLPGGTTPPAGLAVRGTPVDATLDEVVTAVPVRPTPTLPAGTRLMASRTYPVRSGWLRFDATVALADGQADALIASLIDDEDVESGAVWQVVGDVGGVLWTSKLLNQERQQDTVALNVAYENSVEVRLVVKGQYRDSLPTAVHGVLLHSAFRGEGPAKLRVGTLVAMANEQTAKVVGNTTPDLSAIHAGVLCSSTPILRPPFSQPWSAPAGVSARSQCYRVTVLDADTGLVMERTVPGSQLFRITSIHGVQVSAPSSYLKQLQAAAAATSRALTIHAARAAVQAILVTFTRHEQEMEQDRALKRNTSTGSVGSGRSSATGATLPPYTIPALGGPHRLLQLIKLAAANDATVAIGISSKAAEAAATASSMRVVDQLAADAAALALDEGASPNAAAASSTASGASADGPNASLSAATYGMASLSQLRYVLRHVLMMEKRMADGDALPTMKRGLSRDVSVDSVGSDTAGAPPPMPTAPPSFALRSSNSVMSFDASTVSTLSGALVSDCIANFVNSIRPPAHLLRMAESTHPLPAHGVYTGSITIPDVPGLEVHFDPRSCTDDDHGEVLSLYTCPDMTITSCVGTYGGPPAAVGNSGDPKQVAAAAKARPSGSMPWPIAKPVVVPGSQLYWKLTCGDDATLAALAAAKEKASGAGGVGVSSDSKSADESGTKWVVDRSTARPGSVTVADTAGCLTSSYGFRFLVKPAAGKWTREADVLSTNTTSLAWSCWLLDFLLNQVALVLKRGAVHNQRMYDALVTFLRTKDADPAIQSSVVALLSQLLIHPHMFATFPNLDTLKGVEATILKVASDMLSATSSGSTKSIQFLPPKMQALLELVVARNAAKRALQAAEKARQMAAAMQQYPGEGAGAIIRIPSAVMAASRPSRPAVLTAAAVVPAFHAAYPSLAAEVRADMVAQAWAGVTDGDRTGAVRVATFEPADPQLRVMLEAMWHVVHPDEDADVLPEDATVDLYDFVFHSALMLAGDYLPESDPLHAQGRAVSLATLYHAAQIARSRGIMAAELDDAPTKLAGITIPTCLVPKPWEAGTGGAGGAGVSDALTTTVKAQLVEVAAMRPAIDNAKPFSARLLLPASISTILAAAPDVTPPAAAASGGAGASAGVSLPAVPGGSGTKSKGPFKSHRVVVADTASGGAKLPSPLTPGSLIVVDSAFSPATLAAVIAAAGATGSPHAILIGYDPLFPTDASLQSDTAADREAAVEAMAPLTAAIEDGKVPDNLAILVAQPVDVTALAAAATKADKESADAAGAGVPHTWSAKHHGAPPAAAGSGGTKLGSTLLAARLTSKAASARDASRLTSLQRGLASRDMGVSTAAAYASLVSSDVGRGGVSSFGAVPLAAKLRPDAAASTWPLLDKLLYVHEISAALSEGARPRDEILCGAWMDAIGTHRLVESNHPLRSGEVVTGEVVVEEATQLKLTFHPRCATAPGVFLTLMYAGTTRTFGGPARPEDGSGDGDDAEGTYGNWPVEPLTISAGRFKYTLRVPERSVEKDWGWGVSFTASAPTLNASQRMLLLNRRRDEVVFASKQVLTQWTAEMDGELSDLARSVCSIVNNRKFEGSTTRHTLLTLPLSHLALLTSQHELRYASLASVPPPLLRMRFALMRQFNTLLQTVLPAFSLTSVKEWTVGYRIRNLSHIVFLDVKRGILESALTATTGSGGGSLTLSNFKATASEVKGDVSPETSACMFAQAYFQLRGAASGQLRGLSDTSQSKVFNVSFEGESGIDAGGVYREGVSRIIDDLFSDRFNLLIKTPNAKKGYKINTNSYVPNSSLRTPLALSMLEFTGRLMGMSLRTKACLPFEFPSLVWKAMVGDHANLSDLIHMDAMFAEFLVRLRDCDTETTSATGQVIPAIRTEEEFAASYANMRFVVTSCTGAEVELVPGGADVPITLANRVRYVEAATRYRLHEFDTQLAAIRRGLANVVPIASLALFTWQECEVLVAGSPEIDIEYLRKYTVYEGYSADHAVIRTFWRVFATFTHEQRSNYIRFVWGRSRLPPEGMPWTNNHKITRLSGGDRALPMAHTCFNTIDLPEYTTDERMAWGLTTAMAYGIGGILNG